jgi:cyclic pyranopterin phosphate synthase
MRITSMGVAKSCLFAEGSIDLQPLIRKGDEAALREALRRLIAGKPKRHSMSADTTDHAPMAMSQVGG